MACSLPHATSGSNCSGWQCLHWLLGSSRVNLIWRKWKWNRILAESLMIFSSEYYEPGPAHNATHVHTCIHTHTHTHLFLFNACDNCSAWHKFPLFGKVKILLLQSIKLFRPFTHSYSSWSAPLIFKEAIRDLCANSAEICTFVTFGLSVKFVATMNLLFLQKRHQQSFPKTPLQ